MVYSAQEMPELHQVSSFILQRTDRARFRWATSLRAFSLWFFPAGLVALRSITINSIRYLVRNKEEMEDLLVISYAVVRPSQAFSINRYSCQIHFPSPRSLSFEFSSIFALRGAFFSKSHKRRKVHVGK